MCLSYLKFSDPLPETHILLFGQMQRLFFSGSENFDPKARRFTNDELKPQPMIKKSKKVIFYVQPFKDQFSIKLHTISQDGPL